MCIYTYIQGTDADLRGQITLHAYLTPLNFTTCNTFIFKPAQPCLNPPRSNTRVRAYFTGISERCAWDRIKGQIASECNCNANAALDEKTGDCVCNLGTYGDGRRFCYPVTEPLWRPYYGELMTGQAGPPSRYGHGWVTVGDSIWLFGGYEEILLRDPEELDVNGTNGTNVTSNASSAAATVANSTNNTNGSAPKYQTNLLGDLHVFSTRFYMWTSYGDAVDSGGPPARAHHAVAAWDRFIFVHGGVGANDTVLGDLYMLDTYIDEEGEIVEPLWTDLNTVNDPPSPRLRHAMAAVTRDDGTGVLYVYGGVTQLNGTAIGELYEFDVATKAWRNILYSKGPKARFYHA
jgi:hypothetical protein